MNGASLWGSNMQPCHWVLVKCTTGWHYWLLYVSRWLKWLKELVTVIIIAQNPLDTFPRNFPVDGEVANLLATMATGHCNGIWETTRHNGLLPVSACYRLAADLLFMLRTCYGLVIDTTGSRPNLLQTCCGETGVMDFGRYWLNCYNDNEVITSVLKVLNVAFRYIHWTDQNFPKGGREGNVISLIKQCAKLFKDDERYKNDERYINIWIKFVSIFHQKLLLVKSSLTC